MTSKKLEAFPAPEHQVDRYFTASHEDQSRQYFQIFGGLEPFVKKHLIDPCPPGVDPRILHLGAGDSTVPIDLARFGYQNQVCVDFSTKVVERMWSRHVAKELGTEWKCLDARRMPDIPSRSVDIAFDKGTMDAMIYGSPWDPPDEVKQNTEKYMREVSRVLKDDGTFLYVTYRQPQFVKPLLNQDGLWNLDMEKLGGEESSFEYFGFVLTKVKGKGKSPAAT